MTEKPLRLMIIGIVMAGCFISISSCVPAIISRSKTAEAGGCSPPIGNFSEAKLVGTWMAGVPDQRDTLIIKADGTYKQIVHIEFPNKSPINYESDWQPWRLEYSEDKIPYLHLNGMRFCGMNVGIPCDMRDGGGYDFCRDEYLPMNGEGILIVLEISSDGLYTQEPTYEYSLHYPLGSENSWAYHLKSP